jgi:hypothetical protein
MHRNRFVAIIVLILAIFGVVVGYVLYVSAFSPESKAVNVSKQSPVVQRFVSEHPKAENSVWKLYVKSNGSLYTISDEWELETDLGRIIGKPIDGKDHYCWMVHWRDPVIGRQCMVDVYVDKDSWEIILVEEGCWFLG